MERRDFIEKTVLATTVLAGTTLSTGAQIQDQPKSKEVYEWRVYTLRWGPAALDEYFSKALIPALNKLGARKVGAFSELSKSEPLKVYLLIAYPGFEDFVKVKTVLRNDEQFIRESATYNNIPVEQAVYDRYDSSLMTAFDGIPTMIIPESGPRIFEVRSYEGYSEDAVRRKIKMFNDDEIAIFNKVKLNPVFFGEVISGPNLPRLTYMLSFKDMDERDKAWKAFGPDTDWQRVSKLPEYANTVSRIYKTFLEPLPYSQV